MAQLAVASPLTEPDLRTSSGRSWFVLGEPGAIAATSGAGRGYSGHEGEAAASGGGPIW
ncbi:MAG: hypothetical protein ACRDRM_12380 [Pseudonocardiaceae bacterium]